MRLRTRVVSAAIVGAWVFAIAAYLAVTSWAHGAELTTNFSPTGLSSLLYEGHDFLYSGEPRIERVLLRSADGSITEANLNVDTAFHHEGREIHYSYDWGTVRIRYESSGNRLYLKTTVTNTSSHTLFGFFYQPLILRLPSTPAEYDGHTPILRHNTGMPSVLRLDFGTGTLAVANEDVTRPLMLGFPGALDRPANSTIFPLRINTDRDAAHHSAMPYIDRPIAPGQSDEFDISLRFGAAGVSLLDLGADIYERFAQAYPPRLDWPDRRPLGALFLATSRSGWPRNPRGWFLDSALDITTEEGRSSFRERILAWADNSIRILRDMNAQGMITWDIEGQEFPHPVSYVGDPRLIGTLAPEMEEIVDEYFRRFREAGLRTGICIRPQRFRLPEDGQPASQERSPNEAQELIDKITYAKDRWGVSIFYVDSNGFSLWPLSADVIARVLSVHPDVLLIPEHENSRYYGKTAPFHELRNGTASTPATERYSTPAAFSVIYTADGPVEERFEELVQAVRGGDILLFRAWYDDPPNTTLREIYKRASDTAAPEIYVTAPLNGSTVSGHITLSAVATDDKAVTGLQFFIDHEPFGQELLAPPYELKWDTTLVRNGFHNVKASGRDAAGNVAFSNVTITVSNQPAN